MQGLWAMESARVRPVDLAVVWSPRGEILLVVNIERYLHDDLFILVSYLQLYSGAMRYKAICLKTMNFGQTADGT